MPQILLQDVEVSYGTIQALAGVSFEVEGGAVGLLGPNGAGKSTLLKTLLGFIRADSGRVEISGMGMPENSLRARQRIGYMPERDIMSPKVSAVSFLTYCGCLLGMSRVDAMERAHEVLNYVDMGDSRYRKMETYSTGMCQRVKFAQALIHDPKLLFLDEPTNGLDPDGRIEMLELIRELTVNRKVTVLLSSHLLPDVEHVCERVLVLNKGKLVRDGNIDELTALRDGLFEVRIRDRKEAFLAEIEKIGFRWRESDRGSFLVVKPPEISLLVLFETARAQDTQIRHLQPVRARLEEAFMAAIEED